MHNLIKKGGSFNSPISYFTVDTIEDLDLIPKKDILFGSLAYVITTKERYIADSNKEWLIATNFQ